jgi:hypothetical protein
MWWCCGKSNQDAMGCKFSSHEAKNDEEDDALANEDGAIDKNKRCLCCKQYGHTLEKCTKDPNLRTNYGPLEELHRIANFKNEKPLYADTIVSTTQFLKKCIVI